MATLLFINIAKKKVIGIYIPTTTVQMDGSKKFINDFFLYFAKCSKLTLFHTIEISFKYQIRWTNSLLN